MQSKVDVIKNKGKLQWDILNDMNQQLLTWTKQNNIRLHTIHFIPHPQREFEVKALFFYAEDQDIVEYANNGITEAIEQHFKVLLETKNYRKRISGGHTLRV